MITIPLALAMSLLGEPYLGAPIPSGSVAMGEQGRYEVPRSYDDVIDYYENHFKREGGIRWRSIVNLPHIRGKHVQSTRSKTLWQGINIYEKGGKVRIFVVPRSPNDAAPPSS